MTLVLDLADDPSAATPAWRGDGAVRCGRGPTETPVVQSPRTILKQQLEAAASRGYAVLASTELEFMAFHTSYEDAWNAHYRDLAAGQPVQRRLLDHGRQPDRTAAARRSATVRTPQGSMFESIKARRNLGTA